MLETFFGDEFFVRVMLLSRDSPLVDIQARNTCMIIV
jgi:hypothetical protein